MDFIFCVGVVLLLSTCVLTQDPPPKCFQTNRACDSNCTMMGGVCKDGGCCVKDYPHEHCYKTNGTCGMNCTMKGGVCTDRGCCFKEPPHLKCLPMNGTCTTCSQKGGHCMDGKCCFSEDPHEHCYKTNGTCGMNCTMKGGVCTDHGCCFKEPPHLKCLPINGTCTTCTQKGGHCMDGKCCFSEGPGEHCYQTNGTCGMNCTNHHGRCVMGKCCHHEQDSVEVEDSDDDKQKGDYDDSHAESSDDDDDAEGHDDNLGHKEEYIDHNGMKVRCTKLACANTACTRRGGYCLSGKCCFKKTEHEAQSLCEKERRLYLHSERQAGAGSQHQFEHVNCTTGGSFHSRCLGNMCHCLNASSGERIGPPRRVSSINKINCDDVQEKTKAEHVNLTIQVSSEPMSRFSAAELEEIKTQLQNGIEMLFPVKPKARLYQGSIMAEVQMQKCMSDCAATANTSDLYSIATETVSQIEQGIIVLDVNGHTMTPTKASISGIATADALTDSDNDFERQLKHREHTMMTIVIAVVAVAIVVVLVTVGLAFYCHKKGKNVTEKEKYFSNLQGSDNPVYMKA